MPRSASPPCKHEDRLACRVTAAWLRSHQIGSFRPYGVFLDSASWEHGHFIKSRLAPLQTFLEDMALSNYMEMNLLLHCSEYSQSREQSLSTPPSPPAPCSGSPPPNPQGTHIWTGPSCRTHTTSSAFPWLHRDPALTGNAG